MADIFPFPKVSPEAAAAHLFIGMHRLRQLQREGILPRANSSDWDLDAIRRRYIEHLRAVKGNHAHLRKEPKRSADDDDSAVNLERERALLAREQRVGHEFKNADAETE